MFKATGSVLEIEQSELKILQDIAGTSSNSNDVKIMPSAESVVNKKKSSDNVHYTEYENSTTYEVASDTTIPIGGGHDGNKVYYPGDTMTKVIITKNPVDGQYHYENIPWK